MCMYIHTYVYREIQIYSFKLFNYMLVCLEALGISRSKQVLKGQDHKQGINSETQRSKMTPCPMATAFFLRHLSSLYAVQEAEEQSSLSWGPIWRYRETSKDLRGFVKQYVKLQEWGSWSEKQDKNLSLALFSPQDIGCNQKPYKGEG